MIFFRFARNCSDRTFLRAECAAGTFFRIDAESDQGETTARGAMLIGDVRLVLMTIVLDGRQDRVRRRLSQTTQTGLLDPPPPGLEFFQIARFAFALCYPDQRF